MAPTNKEIQQRKTCQLYVYVLIALGKEVPYDIHECADDYDYIVECSGRLAQTLKELESETFDTLVNDSGSPQARELANWWEMYKEADKLRQMFADGDYEKKSL